MKKYNQYRVEDFVLDDDFRAWVLGEASANEASWRDWTGKHPGMSPLVEQARRIILELQTKESGVPEQEIDEGYREIEAFFDKTMQKNKRWFARGFWKVAAVLLALVVAGLGVIYQHQPSDQMEQYITRGGQQKKVKLPDGSRVYMKENSRLSYSLDWDRSHKRTVNLQGEAYFQVREQLYQGRKVKFVVSANDVAVEVVGTEFIVNNRSGKTRVALNSGKIRLKVPLSNEPLSMSPGDVVEYDASSNRLSSSKKDVGPKSTWLKKFENSHGTSGNKPSGFSGEAGMTRGATQTTTSRSDQKSTATINNTPGRELSGHRNYQPENQHSEEQPLVSKSGDPITSSSASGSPAKHGGTSGGTTHQYIMEPVSQGQSQASGNTARTTQSGNQNNAYIEQIGDNLTSKQEQYGHENEAEVSISGSRGKRGSNDVDWSTWQLQQGYGNTSIFKIVESYNSNMHSIQVGTNNDVNVESQGPYNEGIIIQQGIQNQAIIYQEGQSNNVGGLSPLDPGVIQNGQFNQVDIDQFGAGNRTRNIQQGSNNTIKVNQEGN
jgi:ferric-dicitrate binding protein FerR (iron transport regulator)